MADRPFMNLGTADVYKKAESAAKRSDTNVFEQCLRELGSRKRGADLVDELQELRDELKTPHLPPALAKGFQAGDIEDLTVVADSDCHRRLDMLRGAKRSIWLSTYTIKDGSGDLRKILGEKARRDVAVNVIASPGPIRPGGHAEEVLDDLRQARVRVIEKTNHSKCVVVDEEYVMVGSANLQDRIYRDVGLQFRSRSVARVLIEYLGELVSSEQ